MSKKDNIISDLEKVFNKYSFEELTTYYDEITFAYTDVRFTKYHKEREKNSKYGPEFLDKLYKKDKDFKEIIDGICRCADYQVRVLEFEEKQKLMVGAYDDIFQCGPSCRVGVLDKFKDITQNGKLANVFSDWWVDKFAKTDKYLKDKNIYRIYLLENDKNNIEYNVIVNYNKDMEVTSSGR